MKLRTLDIKDAPLMLEWMHDDDVVHFMGQDFASKSIEDCQNFIQKSNDQDIKDSLHLAVVDDLDEYMGTVSLKNINNEQHYAEFAITIRKCAMGKGYSQYAMKEIIKVGLDELNLCHIIWCVAQSNIRAVRFYDKSGFKRIENPPEQLRDCYHEEDLLWYEV